MSFDTLQFAAFFPIVLGLYLLVESSTVTRNLLLLLASYFFYASWDWRFLSLLLLATIVNYTTALLLDKRVTTTSNYSYSPAIRKALLAAAIILTLGQLVIFKYTEFIIGSFDYLLLHSGQGARLPIVEVILPVGVSFFTFQAMGYTLDVYHGQTKAESSPINFALFVAFFPQLVAGPIVRAREFLPQLAAKNQFNLLQFYEGCLLIFWGLFKKLFVANNLAQIVDPAFANSGSITGGAALIALYAFAFQIYADFSGYTDIALGCALCMGFTLPPNFNLPYFASNIRDFWSRWHISLTTWFRDYLFYPLSRYLLQQTSRRAAGMAQAASLVVTMTLIGLWHGAAWTFVVWGLYHGLLLISYRQLAPILRRYQPAVQRWSLAGVFLVFHLVCFGWLIFRAESFAQIEHFLQAIWRSPTIGLFPTAWLVIVYVAPLLTIQLLQHQAKTWNVFRQWQPLTRGLIYTALLYLLLLQGNFDGEAFIYFQF